MSQSSESDANVMQHVMELEEVGNRLFTDISEDHKDQCFGRHMLFTISRLKRILSWTTSIEYQQIINSRRRDIQITNVFAHKSLALQEFCVVPVGEKPHKSILVGDFRNDSDHQLLNLVSNGVNCKPITALAKRFPNACGAIVACPYQSHSG